MLLVFDAFQLDASEYISFQFTNNHHAPITLEQLPRLIAQHKKSGSFFIEVILDQPNLCLRAEVVLLLCYVCVYFFFSNVKHNLILNTQGIRNYLVDLGMNKIMEEYQLVGDLSKKSRKTLTDGMMSYLTKTLPNIRDTADVTAACNAMITLFPLLTIVSIHIIIIIYSFAFILLFLF